MENSQTNLKKLKNKKKDFITTDTPMINTQNKTTTTNDKSKQITQNTNKSNDENINNGMIIEDVSSTEKINGKTDKNVAKSDDGFDKNQIYSIVFNIQLLLSISDKVDDKLVDLLSLYLSPEQMQSILEERDCRGVCGNMLCSNKISQNSEEKKYLYNPSNSQFTKDELSELFCNIRCLQKYKDAYTKTKKFDFFRLMNIETIVLFSKISEYYPYNEQLSLITKISNSILEKNTKYKIEEIKDRVLVKCDRYFYEESHSEITEDMSNLFLI
jgi:hypothetical protein